MDGGTQLRFAEPNELHRRGGNHPKIVQRLVVDVLTPRRDEETVVVASQRQNSVLLEIARGEIRREGLRVEQQGERVTLGRIVRCHGFGAGLRAAESGWAAPLLSSLRCVPCGFAPGSNGRPLRSSPGRCSSRRSMLSRKSSRSSSELTTWGVRKRKSSL